MGDGVPAASAASHGRDCRRQPTSSSSPQLAPPSPNPQARLLWPDVPVECVVSLGCGAPPVARRERLLSAYFDTGAVLAESACSTDRVNEAMLALSGVAPGLKYFRCAARRWAGARGGGQN